MKSNIQIIPLLFCLVFVVFSCKKKEVTKEQPANQDGYYHPDKVNSVLAIGKFLSLTSSTLHTDSYYVQAFFSDTLTNDYVGNSSDDYGNVKLDSTILKKQHPPNQSSPCFYYDTTATIYEGLGSWMVQGNIPSHSFTVNNNIDYPIYTNWKNIPDTIDVNKILFLDFSELNNGIYDISVTIFGPSGNLTKPLALNTHSITFTPNELQNVFSYSGYAGNITIHITKSEYRIINTLIIDFQTALVLQKSHFFVKS